MSTTPRKRELSAATKAYRATVYEIVRAIPSGRVSSYGRIASLIPPPRGMNWDSYERVGARWVGYAMADCPDDVPWHRVVNAQGRPSPRPGLDSQTQRVLLEAEGVPFSEEGRIDLTVYLWEPGDRWLAARGLLVRRAPSTKARRVKKA